MICITGDTHIPEDIHKLSAKRFPQQKMLTKDDHVIICGDFGGVWDGGREEKYWLKWLRDKKFTTLFVDGNHENFEMLCALPVEEYCGGCVHKVDDGIYHLMRGEVYFIDEKRFFVFGGASSHDKEYRTEGKNWWSAEMPSKQEYEHVEKNIIKHGMRFDYVITHCAPTFAQKKMAPSYEVNELTEFLEMIRKNITYNKWFFGHYHMDVDVDERFTAVFDDVICLGR